MRKKLKKNPLFYDNYPYVPVTSMEGELDKIPTSFDSKIYYQHHSSLTTPSRSLSSLVGIDQNRLNQNRNPNITLSLPTLPSMTEVSSSPCPSFAEVDPFHFSSALPRKEFLIAEDDNDTEETEEDFESDESDSEEQDIYSITTLVSEKSISLEKESG